MHYIINHFWVCTKAPAGLILAAQLSDLSGSGDGHHSAGSAGAAGNALAFALAFGTGGS